MIRSFKIEKPKCSRIVIQKDRNIMRVYYKTEIKYNKDKKCNFDKRIAIGKMVDDKYMYPNDNFFDFFPDLYPLDEPVNKSGALNIGMYAIAEKLFDTLGMTEMLTEVYKSEDNIIKDLVLYLIISEDNVVQHFCDYEYNHHLFNDRTVSDSYICEMFQNIEITTHEYFLDLWNEIQPKTENVYISYDSTNCNTSSKGIEMAEMGLAKDDKNLPIVNTGTAYNHSTGRPLFYENYPGSIIDNTQFKYMIDRCLRYGYKNVGFILDRGYFSKFNIKYMDENHYKFLMMAKGNALFVKSAIDEAKIIMEENSSNYIKDKELQGVTIMKKLYVDDEKERYFHVYYDDVRAAYEKNRIRNECSNIEDSLNNLVNAKVRNNDCLKKYSKYFDLKFENEILISFTRKEERIKKELNRCGCFVIISSEKFTAEEALYQYRHRDAIEKIFEISKSFLGEDIYRVHSSTSLNSKQQMIFIAEILRNEIFNRTTSLRIKDKKNFTVPSIIRELEKIQIIQDSNKTYRLRFALTKKQKNILECFDLNESTFIANTNKICLEYKKDNSL